METATLQLPKDLIESAIKQHVQVAMAQALGDRGRILETAVHQVLTGKVDSEGKPSRGYGNEVEFIQWAVRDAMQTAVKEAIKAEVKNHADRIRAQIVSELQKKNSPLMKQLAEGMVKGVVDTLGNAYRVSVNLTTA